MSITRLKYRVVHVDPLEEEDDIVALQKLTFDNTALKLPVEQGEWWLVYHNEVAIGFASLHSAYGHNGYRTGFLSRTGILPAHRGHGLQRRLIRAREALGRKRGYNRMVTYTIDSLESANNLLRSGYRMYDGAPKLSDSKRAIHWTKDL